MPDDILEIIRVGVLHLDVWNETVRCNGEFKYRTDGSFTEVCHLPEEDVKVLQGYGMEYLENDVALRNARCAEAVRIIKEFRAEVEKADWYGH